MHAYNRSLHYSSPTSEGILPHSNSVLTRFLKEEFYERLEESDIHYHFQNNHANYEAVQDIVSDSLVKQMVDDGLKQRQLLLEESLLHERSVLVRLLSATCLFLVELLL